VGKMKKEIELLVEVAGVIITPETKVDIVMGQPLTKGTKVVKIPRAKSCKHGIVRVYIPIRAKEKIDVQNAIREETVIEN
jgi:hypothetical protein